MDGSEVKEKKMGILEWIGAIARYAIGVVLIMSGASKISYPYLFLSNVLGYQLSGFQSALIVSLILPGIELACGLCLISNVLTRGALFIAAVMFFIFSAGQFSVLIRHIAVSCGCFSAMGSQVSKWTLLRVAIFLAITLLAMLIDFILSKRGSNWAQCNAK